MRNSFHLRLRCIFAAAILTACGFVLSGCGGFSTYELTTASVLTFKGYEDSGRTMVFHVTGGTTSTEHGTWSVNMELRTSEPLRANNGQVSNYGSPPTAPSCAVPGYWRQWSDYDFRVPTKNWEGFDPGDNVALQLHGEGGVCGNPNKCGNDRNCDEDMVTAWTNFVEIPRYVALPVASVFAHALPPDERGTLLDARQSSGDGPFTYAWSPAACSGTTYAYGFGHDGETVPAGTSWYAGTVATTCTVVVTNANGSTSASISMPAIQGPGGLKSGLLSFSAGTVVVSASYQFPQPEVACLDLDNSGTYSSLVSLNQDGRIAAYAGSKPLTQTAAGTHRVSATLWTAGANDTCANTTATGAAQVISNLYTVDAAGTASEARRGLRSSSFVAPSSLRFVSTKTINEGTYDTKSTSTRGATMSGSFTWSTPATAGGVKRPAGAAKLAKGAYVMRSIAMIQGPSVAKASTLLGTGTVLLRGTDGTMACGTLAGDFDSSTLTLAGGTRSARTLAGTVTGKQVTYVFPTPAAAAASRSGGESGMLARALGWITGNQPAERAKKPTKKPKPIKVKPVTASGTASLQTAAKSTGLPASCKALVQYLP